MKKIYIILMFLVCNSVIYATNIIEQADSAYSQDNFIEAIELYNKVLSDEGSSSTLYYNLGNSYYRVGKLGKAIVCYERAIILDPSNKDAIANLEFVNGQIIDKPGDNGTWIYNSFNKIITSVHANSWATYALLSFLILLSAIILYVFSSRVIIKKIGFFSSIILLFITIVTNIFAYKAAIKSTTHNMAIIIEPSTILSTSPRLPKDRTEEAMLLHEGTKIEILDSISNSNEVEKSVWYDVKVDNSHRAWIRANVVEKI